MDRELRYLRRRALDGDIADVHAYIAALRRRGVSYEVPRWMLKAPEEVVVAEIAANIIKLGPDGVLRRQRVIATLRRVIEEGGRLLVSPGVFTREITYAHIQCHHVVGLSNYRQSAHDFFNIRTTVEDGLDDKVRIQIDDEVIELTVADLRAIPTPPNMPPLAEVLESISLPYGSFETFAPRAPSGRDQPWRQDRPWHPSRVRR